MPKLNLQSLIVSAFMMFLAAISAEVSGQNGITQPSDRLGFASPTLRPLTEKAQQPHRSVASFSNAIVAQSKAGVNKPQSKPGASQIQDQSGQSEKQPDLSQHADSLFIGNQHLIYFLGAILFLIILLVYWFVDRSRNEQLTRRIDEFDHDISDKPGGLLSIGDDMKGTQQSEELIDREQGMSDKTPVDHDQEKIFDIDEQILSDELLIDEMDTLKTKVNISLDKGRYQEAMNEVAQAVRLRPTAAFPRELVMKILYEKGDKENFVQEYQSLHHGGYNRKYPGNWQRIEVMAQGLGLSSSQYSALQEEDPLPGTGVRAINEHFIDDMEEYEHIVEEITRNELTADMTDQEPEELQQEPVEEEAAEIDIDTDQQEVEVEARDQDEEGQPEEEQHEEGQAETHFQSEAEEEQTAIVLTEGEDKSDDPMSDAMNVEDEEFDEELDKGLDEIEAAIEDIIETKVLNQGEEEQHDDQLEEQIEEGWSESIIQAETETEAEQTEAELIEEADSQVDEQISDVDALSTEEDEQELEPDIGEDEVVSEDIAETEIEDQDEEDQHEELWAEAGFELLAEVGQSEEMTEEAVDQADELGSEADSLSSEDDESDIESSTDLDESTMQDDEEEPLSLDQEAGLEYSDDHESKDIQDDELITDQDFQFSETQEAFITAFSGKGSAMDQALIEAPEQAGSHRWEDRLPDAYKDLIVDNSGARPASHDVKTAEATPTDVNAAASSLRMAQSYVDMDMPELATPLLKDVILVGSAEQQQKAQELMQKLQS